MLVNTYTNNVQTAPAIATLSDGRFVVVWQSAGQNGKSLSPYVNHGIYGQLFSSTGIKIGGEFVISSSGAIRSCARRPGLSRHWPTADPNTLPADRSAVEILKYLQ